MSKYMKTDKWYWHFIWRTGLSN